MRNPTTGKPSSVIHMSRSRGGPWAQSGGPAPAAPAVAHADEPHFQKKIVELGLPLVFGGHAFTPLCSEFPASPGVDIVYLCVDTGRMVFAELKKARKSADSDATQCLACIWKNRDRTVADIRAYIEANPLEAHPASARLLDEALSRGALRKGETVRALLGKDFIHPALVYNSSPPLPPSAIPQGIDLIAEVQFFDRCSRSVTTVSDRGAARPAAGEALRLAEDAHSAYAQRLAKQNNSSRRSRAGHDAIRSFFLGLPEGAPTRVVFAALLDAGADIESCTGGAALTQARMTVDDSEGKPRCVVILDGASRLEVRGNLHNQSRNLGLADSDVDAFMSKVDSAVPFGAVTSTPSNTRRISFEKIPHHLRQSVAETVAGIVRDFVALVRSKTNQVSASK
jgi:hypothetical protein